MDKAREIAKAFRELADLYDELANIDDDEKAQEEITGKILVKILKLEQLK